MRYLIFFVLFCFPFLSYATDMCARDDTMVMVFDPDVGIKDRSAYAGDWKASFPYGNFSGEYTCLSAAEGLGRTSSTGVPYYGVGEYDKTFISATAGLKGVDEKGNERKYLHIRYNRNGCLLAVITTLSTVNQVVLGILCVVYLLLKVLPFISILSVCKKAPRLRCFFIT